MIGFNKGDIIVAELLPKNTGSSGKSRTNKYAFIRMSDAEHVLAFPIRTKRTNYSFQFEINGKPLWIDYCSFERIPYSLTSATGVSVGYDVIIKVLEERKRMRKSISREAKKKMVRTYIKIVQGGDCAPK